jgi:hypothetical protein
MTDSEFAAHNSVASSPRWFRQRQEYSPTLEPGLRRTASQRGSSSNNDHSSKIGPRVQEQCPTSPGYLPYSRHCLTSR